MIAAIVFDLDGRIDVPPVRGAAVEDSANRLRSAAAMTVIAAPNREFPPAAEALALAATVLDSIEQLRPELIQRLGQENAVPDGS